VNAAKGPARLGGVAVPAPGTAARRGIRALPVNPLDLAGRAAATALLTASGYIHLDLYLNGYRVIPKVGTLFLIQANGSFAVALLLLLTGSFVPRLAAAGLSAGALFGFVLSRTVGVFGFTERGLQPDPQALASILVEAALLIVLAVSLVPLVIQAMGRRSPATTR
jgi:hypothetical protein